MHAASLIRRKRDEHALTREEIDYLVAGYVTGDVPDYQMSAWAMAVCLRGMTADETTALTSAMLHSGQVMEWPGIDGPVVDKHSTGGIGDKVSLVLAPLLACEGMYVPMISGRGLGPTGGTLDKLEAIAGYRTDLSLDEVQRITREIGCVITGATDGIAPADKKLYALRDVTATVESIPLITGSIMSKKLAEGLDALVLDVKFGSGAFMKTRDDAQALAQSLVATGKRMHVATAALLTDMNQPLGRMAGNAVEVLESMDALAGNGPEDLVEVTLQLGAELMRLADVGHDIGSNVERLQAHITSGAALEKFHVMIVAQGGDPSDVVSPAQRHGVAAEQAGIVQSIDTHRLGEAIIELGGGRKLLTDPIDHGVGLEMLVRLGDVVDVGQPLTHIFAPPDKLSPAMRMVREAIAIGDRATGSPDLIVERVCDAPHL